MMDNNPLLLIDDIILPNNNFNSYFNYDIILPNTVEYPDNIIQCNLEYPIQHLNDTIDIPIQHSLEIEHNDIISLIDLDNITSNSISNINLIENKLDISNHNILYWQEQYNKYCELEKLCNININYIIDIKNNLINLAGYHDKDDIIFYQSIIGNSIFYLSNSLKIRKIKFLNDLNNLWLKINNNYNKCNKELNKIYFQSLLKDYTKAYNEINISKKSYITLNWIKNNKIKNLQEFEHIFTEILQYHLKLINFLLILINHEKSFYYNT